MINRQPSPELEKLLLTDPGHDNILQRLDLTDYGRLSQSCYGMSQFFKNRPSSFWLVKLAHCLAQAPDDNKVKFIIKNNPQLLQVVFKEVAL